MDENVEYEEREDEFDIVRFFVSSLLSTIPTIPTQPPPPISPKKFPLSSHYPIHRKTKTN